MKSIFTALFAVLTVSGASLGQDEEDDWFYAGARLGLSQAGTHEIDSEFSGLSLSDNKKLGPVGDLVFGRLHNNWRVELNYSMRWNTYNRVDVANPAGLDLPLGESEAGGQQKSQSLLVNLHHRLLGSNDDWSIWAGLGIGLSHIDTGRFRSGGTLIIDDSDWRGAGQAMLTFMKPISDRAEFGVGYRYFRTYPGGFLTEDGSAEFGFSSHDVFAQLTFKLGGQKKKRQAAPAPTPIEQPEPEPAPRPAPTPQPQVTAEPEPEPEPAPLPGPFLVFFDWDSTDITSEAQRIISAAARAFRENRVVRLQTTGHADRSGPTAYNLGLSRRRAEAVQAALIRAGVSADQITIDYKGESDPLVPTEDGVREPQNRRAEIILTR